MSNQPASVSPLLDNCFRFVFDAIPDASYFVQITSLPGFSLPISEVKGVHGTHKQIGTGIEWENLPVKFLCDKNLDAWIDIYTWMNALGSPQGFKHYLDNVVNNPIRQEKATARLHLLTPKLNPSSHVISFYNCFPYKMGQLDFSSINTEVKAVTFDVIFVYSHYERANAS